MKTRFSGLILFLLFMIVAAHAQPQMQEQDPIAKNLIGPEIIMKHQKAIRLSDQQREAIMNEIGTSQALFNELHWHLQEKMEIFKNQLAESKIDEKAALMQLEEVLEMEAKIKKAQMTLMIRIKNHLTKEQQNQLRSLQHEKGLP